MPRNTPEDGAPLRVAILSYRSNPHCGGQGVYVKNLARALAGLGHRVTVISGPPDPGLEGGVDLVRIPCLDLYDPADPFRVPRPAELADPVNLLEWIGVSTMGFPEPLTFGMRAFGYLRRRLAGFDVLHDNQSLSYGIWALSRRQATVATIHHPLAVDRRFAVRAETGAVQKLKQWRWYSFFGMQKRVARCLTHLVTVSEAAGRDIRREFGLPAERLRVVPNGIDTARFRPLPGVAREPGRIIATNSADMPLKGLSYLLEAVARLLAARKAVRLVVIGAPKPNGAVARRIAELGIGARVEFTGRIDSPEFVRQYARASLAVVPSVYEGFGLPVGEAMACAVPVVSTTGGALPEVVGDAGLLVPPADPAALAAAIRELLDHPERADALGWAGHRRVHARFTWRRAAESTTRVYREAINAHRRFRPHRL
jgi:glycosyltransferase involved in cell wall biosynthesis